MEMATAPEVCEICGQVHLTPHNKPACPSHITSGERRGSPCKNELGKGTKHPGIGQCRKHGGNTSSANSHAQNIMVEQELQALGLTDWEPVADPYTMLADIAGKTVALQERLHEKVEELSSLRQYGGEMGDRIDVVFEAFERSIDRCIKVGTSLARLDLDARIAKLHALVNFETAEMIRKALSGALGAAELTKEQREAILHDFGSRLRTSQPAISGQVRPEG